MLARAIGGGADTGAGVMERGGTMGAGVITFVAAGGVCVGGGALDAARGGVDLVGAGAVTADEPVRRAGRAGSGGANNSISRESPTKPIATAAAP